MAAHKSVTPDPCQSTDFVAAARTSLARVACLFGRASDSWSSHLIRVSPACLSSSQQRAMQPEERPEAPEAPSAPWRVASIFTMGAVGLLCKGFLGLNKIETYGMERFLRLLDERQDPKERERGLITCMRPLFWKTGTVRANGL